MCIDADLNHMFAGLGLHCVVRFAQDRLPIFRGGLTDFAGADCNQMPTEWNPEAFGFLGPTCTGR
jgi:hypothetical protein